MKKYESPYVEMTYFNVEDIITSSPETGNNAGPWA